MQLLVGRGAAIQLEIRDIVIRIGLESCVGKLFCKKNGGLGDLCNNSKKSEGLNPSIVDSSRTEGNDSSRTHGTSDIRETKQRMIDSAEHCLLEKREIPPPEVDGNFEGTHPGRQKNATENAASSNLLETFV